jgi:hypothetical protein
MTWLTVTEYLLFKLSFHKQWSTKHHTENQALKTGVKLGAPERLAAPAPLVLGIQLVLFVVVEVYSCILEVVQILHQMKLGRRVLESFTKKSVIYNIHSLRYISRRKAIPVK